MQKTMKFNSFTRQILMLESAMREQEDSLRFWNSALKKSKSVRIFGKKHIKSNIDTIHSIINSFKDAIEILKNYEKDKK